MANQTFSMCTSMTGKNTYYQIVNERIRQSYGYYQNAQNIKTFSENNTNSNVTESIIDKRC